MTLATGTRLGPYEIAEPAGTGGMGDVYRAHDTRLDRDVAVKTIKGPFTERFEREARAISALNHPNICTLYDVGQHDGSGYLVMEYIEGKPIAGPLPVEQAIAYGIQICDALHAAHRKGIVHRDLKPANILLTKQSVKLLDFGLAKLAPNGNSGVMSGSAAHAGEQATVAALTGAHTVVGTPQYMAPEQIEAREVDARTDIFAFGCVLYELLTGQRAFEGKTPSAVMAAILATKPRPLEELVPLTPPALERIVSRCLAKDPDDRWQTARDVAAELQWVSQGGSRVGLPAVVTGRRRVREGVAWAACVLTAVVAIAFGVAWARRAPEPPALVRFPLPLPRGLSNPSPPVVAPDGRKIAFAADGDGKRLIWIRSLDAIDPRPLPGTEGVLRPFWSPDSRFVAFFAAGKLKKVDISGGPAQTICDAPNGADGSWNADGVILFDGRGTDPIWRVSSAGGVAKTEIGVDQKAGIFGVGWPEFLPDGRRFLYMTIGENPQDQMLTVGTLDSKEAKPLFKSTSRVLYAEPGYLLFVRERTLVAQKFNLDSLSLEGEAIPLGEGLGVDDVGLASFSVSRNGLLAFRAGELQGRRLVWIDRSGKETPAIDAIGGYRDTSLSPDGKRLVYDVTNNSGSKRPVDPRSGPGRVVALHLRSGRRARPSMVARWPAHRLQLARQRARRSLVKDASARRKPSRCSCRLTRNTCRTGLATAGSSFTRVAPATSTAGTSSPCRWKETGSRFPWSRPSSMSSSRPSRPTANTSPTTQTNRAGRRSTCRSSRKRETSGRCQPRAASQRSGAPMAASCSIATPGS